MLRLLLLLLLAPLWLPVFGVRAVLRRLFPVRILHFDLSGALPDQSPRRGLAALLARQSSVTLPGALKALEEARMDPALHVVALRIKELHCGLARAEEIRQALLRLKQAGKQVLVYAEEYGAGAYWVALGASKLVLPPSGNFNVLGFASEFTLLKGFLDKLGVQAQLAARGKYKSMRETFTESAISDANREMLQALLADLKEQLVVAMSSERSLTREQVEQALDTGPHRAEQAKALGLVDELLYFDQLKQQLEEQHGKRGLGIGGYLKYRRRGRLRIGRPVSVALLNVTGNIKSGGDRLGRGGKQATGSDSLCRAVRRAKNNPRVKAILLRIDSPGGSALASDIMWRELSQAAQEKPTFVSMVNVAASGGYYVAGLKGVRVWASPTTLTGSVGVVGGKFAIEGLLSKLGVSRTQVVSGPRAAYYSATTAWTPEELQKLEADIDASYHDFVSKMAEARNVEFDALHAVAQGRVWTGRQAKDTVLVDHLGGLHEVEQALKQALELPPGRALRWLSMEASGAGSLFPDPDVDWRNQLPTPLGTFAEELTGEAQDFGQERLLALSPVRLKLN